LGTTIEFEWTVEARRAPKRPATVVELPFFNPEPKTATVGS
jgi:hypothetical protein